MCINKSTFILLKWIKCRRRKKKQTKDHNYIIANQRNVYHNVNKWETEKQEATILNVTINHYYASH